MRSNPQHLGYSFWMRPLAHPLCNVLHEKLLHQVAPAHEFFWFSVTPGHPYTVLGLSGTALLRFLSSSRKTDGINKWRKLSIVHNPRPLRSTCSFPDMGYRSGSREGRQGAKMKSNVPLFGGLLRLSCFNGRRGASLCPQHP